MAKRLKHGYGQELQTLKATRERTLVPSVFFASQVKSNQIKSVKGCLPFCACPENGRIPGAIEQNVPSRKEIITASLRERHNANHIV